MSKHKLANILVIIDDDEKFGRFVAEMENPPRLSEHKSSWFQPSTGMSGCVKCGKEWHYTQLKTCPVPDPLTRSFADIVAEKVASIDLPELVEAAQQIRLDGVHLGESKESKLLILCVAYEWFIKAGSKWQLVVCWMVEGQVTG
jgi:hypothetical protein